MKNFLRRVWRRLTCEHHYVLNPDSPGEPGMWARCALCKKPKRL